MYTYRVSGLALPLNPEVIRYLVVKANGELSVNIGKVDYAV